MERERGWEAVDGEFFNGGMEMMMVRCVGGWEGRKGVEVL